MVNPNTDKEALDLCESYKLSGFPAFACTMEYLVCGVVNYHGGISAVLNKQQTEVWKLE